MSVSLQIALVAERHVTDRLALKFWLTTKEEMSLIILVGIRKLSVSSMEKIIIIRKRTIIISLTFYYFIRGSLGNLCRLTNFLVMKIIIIISCAAPVMQSNVIYYALMAFP
jgi:hypothetical protein